MKKSNDPNKARELFRAFGARWPIYTRKLPYRQWEEYNRIMDRAVALNAREGRQAAIEWLSFNRPWLVDYTKNNDLPVSGMLLDWLLKTRKETNNDSVTT